MTIKKGDWIKATREVIFGCNRRYYFCIVKIESLVGSRIKATYFIKNDYEGYVSRYIQLGGEESYFSSIKRKAYSNEIFSSITNFKVSQE